MLQVDGQNQRRTLKDLLIPSLYIDSVYDLPLEWLTKNSINAVITDLDNTLVPWGEYETVQRLTQWFANLHQHGFRTLILSNAKPHATIDELSRNLNTQVIVGAKKPLRRFFREALEALDADPHETCVIGDQLFTDVLGGNAVGCHTVLVNRISNNEFIGTRLVRILESRTIKRLGLEVGFGTDDALKGEWK
ncbi:MAG TPA: YqeG family HAD IIIA-type phosphatase [Bacillota bacterium]|nr:YqeG family HAD IIIA-type phosphatase [Candidatus Fermentithermobacillaceae bacterium]HOB30007.1 YqeG family HAD IIIA-type phosphatase [Bacillota bacterium]HOK63897.1 YqeG family HAD IIIA-type phosphatase [Bacillota bacterium]HOL11252.1 YqeG family HAD IIIA-type phosphatase [Bacillota bacterium]HOQ02381.1 YqeG family HAD IIIA-type phosphatase [Bacillota bacterium]